MAVFSSVGKRRAFKGLSAIILFFVAVSLISTLADIDYQIYAIWNGISLYHWVATSCSYLILLICLAGYLCISLRAMDVRMRFAAALSISIVSAFSNYILFNRSGIGVRAAYLKIRHRVEVKISMLIMLIFMLAHVGLSSVIALAMTVETLLVPDVIFKAIIAFLVCAIVLCVLGIFLIKGAIVSRLICSNLKYWVALSFFSILFFAAGAMQVYFSSNALASDITFSEIMMYSSLRNIAGVVSVTPGGLGLQEAFSVLIGQSMKVGVDVGLAIQLCIRISSILIILALLPYAYWSIKRDLDEREN